MAEATLWGQTKGHPQTESPGPGLQQLHGRSRAWPALERGHGGGIDTSGDKAGQVLEVTEVMLPQLVGSVEAGRCKWPYQV